MPLTTRPFSANTYALSKVWYRCSTINLRQSDINSITYSVKRWLYADMFLKPSEEVLYRPISQGGLGLTSTKHKSLASLLRTFLELSANPSYLPSLFLSSLYRIHVLDEDLPSPPVPPYFDTTFFAYIRAAKDDGHEVERMTTRQWYNFLFGQHQPCRAELASPDTDWSAVWGRVRLPSLTGNVTSLVFKLAHGLLPCESRLADILPDNSHACRYNCPGDPAADLFHCFFSWQMTNEVGEWLINLVKQCIQSATPSQILKLDICSSDALIWVIANTLSFLWSSRMTGKSADLVQCMAKLSSDLIIMCDTKHNNTAVAALDLIQ